MMRILCVLLPHFPLQCELLRNTGIRGNAVVVYSSGSQKLVLDYSQELKRLQPDMPLQEAIACYKDFDIIQADMPRYWSVFNGILKKLETISPLIENADLGKIYLGLEGMQLLYPDDKVLVKAVKEVMPEVFDARFGIAEGKFYAYLAALYSPRDSYKCLQQDIQSFLKDLPCDVLPVSIKIKNRLHQFGLHTLGKIASLEIGPLQAQFGPEGKRIWELAAGYDPDPLRPGSPEEIIEESVDLPSAATSLDVLLTALESLLSQALVRLESGGMGISRLCVWTRSWMSEYRDQTIHFKECTTNTRTVMLRLKHIMETFPQSGPVEQIGLKITGLGRQPGRQKSLFSEVRNRENFVEAVKQLEFRMGGPQLYMFKEVEPWSRIPERRYALIPFNRENGHL
ncbi:hypothetical protein ACFLXC_00045 [Chloroflexota bacterium]